MPQKDNQDAADGNFLTTSRIEALHDGIFAIAMTVLVFGLEAPDMTSKQTLLKTMRELSPIFLSYVVSFINLGVYWVGQHNQFHFIKHSNRILLWINIIFLMFVSIIPFTTSIIGRFPRHQLSYTLYGVVLIIIGLISYWHWCYATKHHRLTDHDLSDAIVKNVKQRILLGPLLSLLAIATSFVSMRLSLVFYVVLPLYYIRPSAVDSVWHRPAVPHKH